MPHDAKGALISEGDIVTIRFRVKQVYTNVENCNVTLESVLSMPGQPDNKINLSAVNTQQTEKEN